MSAKKVFVTAIITVKPEMFAGFESELRECAALSLKEAACERYEVGADIAKVGRFIVSEIWRDEAGFKAHTEQAHFKKLTDSLKKISGEAEIIQTSPFSSIA